MASVARSVDRRRGPRLSPDRTGCLDQAVLRPGLDVRILDIGAFGALVSSPVRLRPGVRTELHLTRAHLPERTVLRGQVARCQVVSLDPLCFHGAIAFDMKFETAARG